MANRFPLIFNSGAGQIQELAASDNLDLTSSNLVNAGILFTSSGSATAPSLQIGSGTTYNPGLYSPGTDQLAISTGGTRRLLIDSGGNVSIDAVTDTGVKPLAIYSATRDAEIRLITNSGTEQNAYVTLRQSGGNLEFYSTNGAIIFNPANTDRARIRADGLFEIKGAGTAGSSPAFSVNQSAPTNSFFIDSGGKLGLGINNPACRLNVVGAAGSGDDGISISSGSTTLGSKAALFFVPSSGPSFTTGSAIKAERLSPDGSDLQFFTVSSLGNAPVRAMTIDSSGRLGIGNTIPNNKLDVSGSISATGAFNNSGFAPHVHLGVVGGNPCIASGNNVASTYLPLVFRQETTNGAGEAMRIDASGRLLVGTTTAKTNYFGSGSIGSNFQVVGSSHAQSSVIIHNEAANTQGPYIHLGKARGTGFEIVSNDDLLGSLIYFGAGGSAMHPAASINAFVDGAPSANVMPSRLVFLTNDGTASASPTERMRIKSNGDIQFSGPLNFVNVNGTIAGSGGGNDFIGVRDSGSNFIFQAMTAGTGSGNLLVGYSSSNGAYKLQVNSQIFATSATIATSDGRYKENVASLGGCLDLVKALRPVSFTWKPQEDITRTDSNGNKVLVREKHNFPKGTQVGFIAQEMQQVLNDKPWLSSIIKENVRFAISDDDGNELAPEEKFLGIAEGNLIGVLTSALQEAIAEIQELRIRVAALEGN